MARFQTFSDLPLADQQEITRIQAIPAAQRNSVEVAYLANRDPYVYNGIDLENADNEIVIAHGHDLPTGKSGFIKGARFIKTNATAGEQATYENVGDEDSATWVLGVRGLEVSTDELGESGSYQPVAVDLNLAVDAGSDTEGDPSFIASIMGNILGVDLTSVGNYLAGLIGAYSITGTKATKYPSAPVMGIVMDGVTDVDAAVLAVIDGSDPSAQTNAKAAFGVRQVNNHASSGVEYGLNLKDEGDETIMTDAKPFKISKAISRSPHDVCWLEGDGAPVDGTTGDNFAGIGSLYSDYTNGDLYIQTGAITSPVWKLVTRAA